MARYDDLNTSAIGYATFISTILFVIVVLLIRALSFYWVEGEADRLQAKTHYTSADAEITRQREQLSSYAKEMVTVFNGEGEAAVEEEVEQLHIPLDAAKQIVLDELATKDADHGEGEHSDHDDTAEHADENHEEAKEEHSSEESADSEGGADDDSKSETEDKDA
ncbi:MAG: hypothetical protein Aurels2KO_08460 [Aureliella sp.]